MWWRRNSWLRGTNSILCSVLHGYLPIICVLPDSIDPAQRKCSIVSAAVSWVCPLCEGTYLLITNKTKPHLCASAAPSPRFRLVLTVCSACTKLVAGDHLRWPYLFCANICLLSTFWNYPAPLNISREILVKPGEVLGKFWHVLLCIAWCVFFCISMVLEFEEKLNAPDLNLNGGGRLDFLTYFYFVSHAEFILHFSEISWNFTEIMCWHPLGVYPSFCPSMPLSV